MRATLSDALAGDEPAAKQLTILAKSWSAKHDHDSLLEALRAGPLLPKGDPKPRGKGKKGESLAQFGSVTTGFTFVAGKDVFRYAVDIPKDYEASTPAPVLIDPGHGAAAQEDQEGKAGYLDYFRHRAAAANLQTTLIVRTEILEQIGAGGVRGERPEDQVCAVFDAFFRDFCSRFAVDLDRVWVSGLSQTGYWSWQLGLTRADRFAGIAPMGSVTWNVEHYLPNLANLAIWVLHGDADPICKVEGPRKTTRALSELGVRLVYKEIAGGKHDYGTWQHLDEGLAWLAKEPRDPYPKKIARNLQTLEQPWCYWIRVDELEQQGTGVAGQSPTAKLAAAIEGQRVLITSKGIEKLTLCLSRELLDLSQPVEVIWNDKIKSNEVLPRDFATTIHLALEKCDWRGLFEASVMLRR